MDAAAEADVLRGVAAADVEVVGPSKTRGSRFAEPKRSETSFRRGESATPPISKPSSSTQRSKSWSGGSKRISSSIAAAAATSPATSAAPLRRDAAQARARRCRACSPSPRDRRSGGRSPCRRSRRRTSRAPSTRASTSADDHVVARTCARRSAMRPRTYSWNSAAASFAGGCDSAGVSNSYIFTMRCDQSSRSRWRSSGTPNIRQITAIEYGCA